MPIVTLLTDFGTSDYYVAAMKGVILGLCPDARLIDITHHIPPFSIPDAAFTLAQAWPCFPEGTIHLTVVDPGVGSPRRALLLEAHGHCFIAPDNGVLTMVYDGSTPFEITESRFFRHPVSRTFHGRDIFAPVAAHLALGTPPQDFGPPAENPTLLPLASHPQVIHVDRYGNLVTSLRPVNRPFELLIGQHKVTRFESTYASAPPNQLFALEGSSGYIEISLNQGDASALTGAKAGTPLIIRYL